MFQHFYHFLIRFRNEDEQIWKKMVKHANYRLEKSPHDYVIESCFHLMSCIFFVISASMLSDNLTEKKS